MCWAAWNLFEFDNFLFPALSFLWHGTNCLIVWGSSLFINFCRRWCRMIITHLLHKKKFRLSAHFAVSKKQVDKSVFVLLFLMIIRWKQKANNSRKVFAADTGLPNCCSCRVYRRNGFGFRNAQQHHVIQLQKMETTEQQRYFIVLSFWHKNPPVPLPLYCRRKGINKDLLQKRQLPIYTCTHALLTPQHHSEIRTVFWHHTCTQNKISDFMEIFDWS